MRRNWCWVYQPASGDVYDSHSKFMCVIRRIVQNRAGVWSGVFISGVDVCEFR